MKLAAMKGCLILAICAIVAWIFTSDSWQYAKGDAITRAGIDTKRKLATYERTGDPTELVGWLRHPDGGTGMQIYITLGEWSCKNQEDFVHLLESMNKVDRESTIKVLSWMLNDSGQDREFCRAFQNSRSPVINEIKKSLR